MRGKVYKTQADSDLRLECLRLAVRPGLGPSEIIANAESYLAWIKAGEPDEGPARRRKTDKPEEAPN